MRLTLLVLVVMVAVFLVPQTEARRWKRSSWLWKWLRNGGSTKIIESPKGETPKLKNAKISKEGPTPISNNNQVKTKRSAQATMGVAPALPPLPPNRMLAPEFLQQWYDAMCLNDQQQKSGGTALENGNFPPMESLLQMFQMAGADNAVTFCSKLADEITRTSDHHTQGVVK
ncbi:hypothetical protein ACOMHN_060735 [Nucella lapillus]